MLLHSFAHALMQRLAIECGYTAASIFERRFSLPPEAEDGPMAGVLIYTAAADSEGTLGGLISLGEPIALGGLLDMAQAPLLPLHSRVGRFRHRLRPARLGYLVTGAQVARRLQGAFAQ